jgi:hypothetical protein
LIRKHVDLLAVGALLIGGALVTRSRPPVRVEVCPLDKVLHLSAPGRPSIVLPSLPTLIISRR